MAAGLATLRLIQVPGFYDRLTASTLSLVEGLGNTAKEKGVTFSAQAVGGMFGLYFRATPPATYAEVMECDKEAFNRFFHAMLVKGVYFAPSAFEAGFVSAAHTDSDIVATIAAADKVFEQMAG
jgi:glutamate-1-semialdehyde 2,1-aminomutase